MSALQSQNQNNNNMNNNPYMDLDSYYICPPYDTQERNYVNMNVPFGGGYDEQINSQGIPLTLNNNFNYEQKRNGFEYENNINGNFDYDNSRSGYESSSYEGNSRDSYEGSREGMGRFEQGRGGFERNTQYTGRLMPQNEEKFSGGRGFVKTENTMEMNPFSFTSSPGGSFPKMENQINIKNERMDPIPVGSLQGMSQNMNHNSPPIKSEVETETSTENKKGGRKKKSKHKLENTLSEVDDDDDSLIEEKVKRRRESQIKASRLYRQRKKEYLKDIEQKLQQLQIENTQLKQQNKKLEGQITHNTLKPAPLFRSYSEELRNTDKDMEDLVSNLNEAILSNNDGNIKDLLSEFHQYMKRRQDILSKEVQQFANPKLQERLVRLVGVSPRGSERGLESELFQWLELTTKQNVSEEQKKKLLILQEEHLSILKHIYKERENIHNDIRDYYQQKILGEQIIGTGMQKTKLDNDVILGLSNKLDLLKKNIQQEAETVNNTIDKISNILSPYQEAVLMLKHYNIYKDKLSTFQVLNNIWKTIGSKEGEI
jgi:hypothetical protein